MKKMFFWIVCFSSTVFSVDAGKVSANIFAMLSGALFGEVFNYTNKGAFEYKPVTLSSPKKAYAEQVYDKIFSETASASILEALYREIFVDFWNKNNVDSNLCSGHDSLFREMLFFTLGWRKSLAKVRAGSDVILNVEENPLKREKSTLHVIALFIGMLRCFVDNKIKDLVKKNISSAPGLTDKPQFAGIFSEMLKIGFNEFLVLPGYYSLIGLLTLSFSQINKEKNKVYRAMLTGMEQKSVTGFYSDIEDTSLFKVSEAGFTLAKTTSTFLKVIELFRGLI